MRYRSEIDGLRAVAVIPVILFHAGFKIFSGGFIGVDVFFVISGYLITTIILSEMDEGTFSILNFYERRARRILPALFFVMALCIPFAWILLTSSDMKDFAKSLVAVSTFSSNILFWRESGYFNPSAELKPLLHTWSLAVEEQYYIFFPLFLMLTWRLDKRWILGMLVIIGFLSLSISEWGAYNKPTPTFYLLPTRGWEILLGAFVAFYYNCKSYIRLSYLANNILSILGILLVLISIFIFNDQTPFPSLFTLIPTVGTVLLILCAEEQTIVQHILSNRLMVGVGMASYSAYLWHQPIFAFAKQCSINKPSPYLMVFLSVLILPLAYLSWRFIEKPFRQKEIVNRTVFFVVSVTFASFFLGSGLFGYVKSGWGERIKNGVQLNELDKVMEVNHGLSQVCESVYTESDECLYGSSPKALLWGDSYAMHLAQALKGSSTNLSFRQHTTSMCRPLLDISIMGKNYPRSWAEQCIEHNNKVLAWLKNNANVRYVVISSPFIFSGNNLLKDGFVRSYDFELVKHSFVKTIEKLRAIDKKIVVVSPPPNNGQNLGGCFSKSVRFDVNSSMCDFNITNYSKNTIEAHKLLKSIEGIAPVIWLDSFICKGGKCSISNDGVPIYRDDGHLSKVGSSLLGKKYDLSGLVVKKAERM